MSRIPGAARRGSLDPYTTALRRAFRRGMLAAIAGRPDSDPYNGKTGTLGPGMPPWSKLSEQFRAGVKYVGTHRPQLELEL